MENWFLNFFDDNYLKIYLENQDPILTKKQVDLIINELSLNAFDRILDLGCGIGRHLIEIGKRGFFGVGIDFNDKYIDLANRSKGDLKNIEFIKMDMREIDFENEFDGVISMWTSFGYFSDEENFSLLKKINRALKKKKRFLLDIENIYYMLKNLPKERWERKEDYFLLEKNELNIKTSRLKTERFIIKENEIKSYKRVYRIFTLKEIELYLKEAGFLILKIFGGYEKEKFNSQSKRLIIISEKL